jgi:hypothetical protein
MKIQRNKGISRVGKPFVVLALGILLVYLPVAAQEDSGPWQVGPKPKSESLAFSLSAYGTLLPVLVSFLCPFLCSDFKNDRPSNSVLLL